MPKLTSQQEYYFDTCKEIFPDKIFCRFMFGGSCLYFDDKIFAIIDKDKIWFRQNSKNQTKFQRLNLEQYIYTGKNNSTNMKMSYFAVPLEVLEDADSLQKWIQIAANY
jgi:TfoX/Sxy family transcriptional regulator of competence genes